MWIVCLQLPKLPSVLRLYATWLSLSLLCLALVLLPPPGPRPTSLPFLREKITSSSPSVGTHLRTRSRGGCMQLPRPSNCSVTWSKSRWLLSPLGLCTYPDNIWTSSTELSLVSFCLCHSFPRIHPRGLINTPATSSPVFLLMLTPWCVLCPSFHPLWLPH